MILTEYEESLVRGDGGDASKLAMEVLLGVAEATGADRLVPITSAHIVGSYYGGEADLKLLQKLNQLNAQVVVPTTLSSSGLDLTCSEDSEEFRKNCQVVEAYQNMGCMAELTCAPYFLDTIPSFGENVAWAESNAVVYANSVLGVRTNMTGQYLDISAALTGRIPASGLYLEQNRLGTKAYDLSGLPVAWLESESIYPLIGLFLGIDLKEGVPVLLNGEADITNDNLRSLSAGLATSGNTGMFHFVGHTVEAATFDQCTNGAVKKVEKITKKNLLDMKEMLTGKKSRLVAICLGTPHFSVDEFRQLYSLLGGSVVSPEIKFLVSTSRSTKIKIKEEGLLDLLLEAGVEVVTDTCTYYGSTLGPVTGTVLTNSAKWAYYAKANLGVEAMFVGLEECVESAISGGYQLNDSFWAL